MSTTRNLPTDGPKRTAGRKKLTTDAGRQILNRERRRLAREQAAGSEEMVLEYRRQAELRARKLAGIDAPARKMERAIDRGLVKRVAGVLASEDLTFQMQASQSPDERSTAWTDFQRISITYGYFTDAKGEPDMRLIAANFRGLAYHEGGHIRWTIPFRKLVEMNHSGASNRFDHLHNAWNILEDQRMETAVVSDSPSKAKYLLPMVMQHNCPNVSMLANNYPYIVWRKYLPRKVRQQGRALFIAAHPEMDEARTTEMERIIESYVMATTPEELLNAVVLFHDMYTTYINPIVPGDESHHSIKTQERRQEATDDMLLIPIDPSMREESDTQGGEGGEGMGEDVPTSSDDLDDEDLQHLIEVLDALFNAPHTLVRIGYYDPSAQGGEDESSDDSSGGSPQPAPEQTEDEGDDDDASEGEGDASGEAEKGTGDSNAPTEGNGAGDGDADDEGADAPDSDEALTDDDLKEMLEEAEEARNSDSTLDADEQAMHEAANEFGSTLPQYNSGIDTDGAMQLRADNLASEVEDAFHAATMDKAPQWIEQQNRGLVNVLRYATREPGQIDFYRQWTDDDAPGFNIAVSVLLDYSSSMIGDERELAAAGYAAKRACERLDIPCTVALWNTGATLLWDHHDKADDLPTIQPTGGTNPGPVLDDIFVQRFDKAVHIVLIMTDGQWQGVNTPGALNAYREDGTFFLCLAYAENDARTAETYADAMRSYGADSSQGITDLMMIPRVLEQALADAVMMS